MEKKLIAIDLDGTTLNNESKISLKTKDVFKKVRDAATQFPSLQDAPTELVNSFTKN